ncbi:MAG: hypothetical protein WDM89_03350 [Rhizomicrobium sp.]
MRPIEPTKDIAALFWVLGHEGVFGIGAFQMIDDRPQPFAPRAVQIDEYGKMRLRIFSARRIEHEPFFAEDEARDARSRGQG